MIESLRRAAIAMNALAERDGRARLVRKVLGQAALLGRAGPSAPRRMDEVEIVAGLMAGEAASWVSPDAVMAGLGGPFDALDLRHWLALAERAGVPFVPAREILRLDADEMDLASGKVDIPDGPLRRRAQRALEALPDAGDRPTLPDVGVDRPARLARLEERLFAAMEGVPEGWMVRSARTGGSELKALAGMGVAGPTVPEVRFGPDLEVGPGWVRSGNRRRVNASDSRTVAAAAKGPDDGACTFLARPWVEAARWFMGDDPHRHGSPYAGKGVWPAEWRAFVEDGRVVGVCAYYGWCTAAEPEDARMALEVRRRAQAMVDEAVATKAYPRLLDLELVRARPDGGASLGRAVVEDLALFGRESVGCTLDFIEVAGEGPVFLEGGPGHTIVGGGSPVSFMGCGGPPAPGRNRARTEGVAFRLMDHVHLAEPSTWTEGDRAGRIMGWDEVGALAARAA